MSVSMDVSVVRNTASPAITAILSTLRNPRPVLEVMGNAAKRVLQDWFRAKPTNAQGWRSSGFWAGQSRGTAVASVSDQEAVVAVSDPARPGALAHRVTGGTITPKRGRFLAIPAMAAAYAAGSPREGGGPGNLAFVYSLSPRGGWRPSLAVQEDVWKEVGKPRKDGSRRRKLVHRAGEVWYWLVRSATQAADPNALPPEGFVLDACRIAALAFLGTSYGQRSQEQVA
jgi:hypothetical protein